MENQRRDYHYHIIFRLYLSMFSIVVLLKNLKRSCQSRIKILTRSQSREPHKNDAAMELLVPFWNMFFLCMLNISSKQELSEPHHLMAWAPPDDVAQCGSIRLRLLFR
jgi:hypothetical protein